MGRLTGLGYGEKISTVSALLLFASMLFNWFDVVSHNTSNLLFLIESVEPHKNAWEALDYIPFALLLTIVVTLAATMLRVLGGDRNLGLEANAAVAVLGLVSTLLILFRIVDPPVFLVEPTITDEGAPHWPIFVALSAAAGIACGGFLAVKEERDHRRRLGVEKA